MNTKTLKLTKTGEVFFSAVFTALAVYSPVLVHYFGGAAAGRKFLPMPFFVLLAGLVLGWRAGLVTALASPVISFLLSGMPALPVLPIITIQLCAYGFFAGLLREKFSSFISLAGAVTFGLIITGIAVFFFSKMSAPAYVASTVKDGLSGIAIQLILLPIILKISKNYLSQ